MWPKAFIYWSTVKHSAEKLQAASMKLLEGSRRVCSRRLWNIHGVTRTQSQTGLACLARLHNNSVQPVSGAPLWPLEAMQDAATHRRLLPPLLPFRSAANTEIVIACFLAVLPGLYTSAANNLQGLSQLQYR